MKRIVSIICLALLCGCGGTGDQRVLEDLGIIHTTSLDLEQDETGGAPDSHLKATVVFPKVEPGDIRDWEVIMTVARTTKEARMHISRQTNRLLVDGQLRNVMFGTALARAGLWEHIEPLIRDPTVGPRVYVTLVEGMAGEMLAKKYPQHPLTHVYIYRLLEKEVRRQEVPEVNLYQFARDYYDDGIEPAVPVLRDAGENIVVDGIALFRKDRYVARFPLKQGLMFAMLRDNIDYGEMVIPISEATGEIVAFGSVKSRRIVKVTNSRPPYRVAIRIELDGSIQEYTGDKNVEERRSQEELESEIERKLQEEAEALLAFMQAHKADGIGIGKAVRNRLSYREWTSVDWQEAFAHVVVDVQVKVAIKDFGRLQ